MFIKIKNILLTRLTDLQPKTVFALIFIFGIVLLIVYVIYRKLGHIKMAKKEYEILQKRGMIGDAYTMSLDEELFLQKQKPAQLRKEPVFPKIQVDKENPIKLDIADYETSLLEEPGNGVWPEESDDNSYATTLL